MLCNRFVLFVVSQYRRVSVIGATTTLHFAVDFFRICDAMFFVLFLGGLFQWGETDHVS